MERLTSESDRRGQELFDLVRWQLGFGARCPGTPAHELFREALFHRIKSLTSQTFRQDFTVPLNGRAAACCNIVALLASDSTETRGVNRPGLARPGPLLLGTHFDTRPIADRDRDPSKRKTPILGANDGGSGTAVLLHLLERIGSDRFSRDILFAFFDAEDVGDLDGNQFAMGSRFFAAHPLPVAPEEVIVLDMVGGRNMIMNIDAHIHYHGASLQLTGRVLNLARSLNLMPFIKGKRDKTRYIVCDHIPFLLSGIPSCVLIDIDYPEWHTHRDLLQAMSPESLVMVEDLMMRYLQAFRL
jgi:hypothetical protein